ncbi:MAG: LamG domain-containing protein [Sedimentisphaerales bacterium]
MMKRLVVIVVVALMAVPSFGQLAGYWNFDEGAGTTVADSSGKGNPGVLQANGSGNLPVWITGHDGTGSALRFNYNTTDSSNSNRVFVDINTADAVAHLGGAFTISMWVRSDMVQDWVLRVPTGNWRWLIYTNAYDIELALDPNASSPLVNHYDYFNSDANSAWSYMPFPADWEDWGQNYTGLWYHLAITYDGNYLKKYVNGYLVYAMAAPTSPLPTATTGLYFAALDDFSGYFSGDLDDVAIWAGTYLPNTEITKLVNGTATPLTVADHNQEPPLPPVNYTMESDMSWNVYPYGDETFYNRGFNLDIYMSSNTAKTIWMASAWWWSDSALTPGTRTAVWDWAGKWFPMTLNDVNETTEAPGDVTTHGMEWIDPCWSGVDPTIAKFAAYVKPGIAICQNNWDFVPYDPSPTRTYSWDDKPYWKTYARVAGYHTQGCSFRVRVYTYPTPSGSEIGNDVFNPLTEPNVLTFIGEVDIPLSGIDYQWQEFRFLLPKAPTIGGETGGNLWKTRHWFEASIVGGDANTVLYIDELSAVSDRYAHFYPGDFDLDTVVGYKDLELLADEWVESNNLDPRSGGLLTNGDFSADIASLGSGDDARVYMNPTGWTYAGTVAGNYGIQRVSKRGEMNFFWTFALTYPVVATPLGGDVAAYLTNTEANDPCSVLSQTASATAVAGQTYYAMGYVMTNTWNGWKDIATMTISIGGVDKAVFTRVLSRNKWRPIYGTYTAVPADAGKSITIKFSYADLNFDPNNLGDMLVGYAYLGTSMPTEWPEERPNLLTNGGFEDLSEVNALSPTLYHYLTVADNYGNWFTSSIHPTTPGWVYEVSSGFDFNNQGGLWGSGYYGSPLPTSGMHDITVYVDNNLILGQVVGSLTAGTTYYLDAACGIMTTYYGSSNWPKPAPRLHVELWRIPAGITDGTVIYNAISGGNSNYVKVAEANVAATGNVLGPSGYNASKWMIIGTTYTATSSDTSMYVRIRGSGGTSTTPEYAFSDVYLSTEKRKVPGGSITYDLSYGLQYDVLGPYDTYHAGVMGFYAADADGSGLVNFEDFAIMADYWLMSSFTDSTGATGPDQDW